MDFNALFPAGTENPFDHEEVTRDDLLGINSFLPYIASVGASEETYRAVGRIIGTYRKTGQVPAKTREMLRDLFNQIASDPSRDISGEVERLVKYTQSTPPDVPSTPPPAESSIAYSMTPPEDRSKDTKSSLLAGWVGQYDPTALGTLQGVIRDYEKDPNFSSMHYAKVIPFIQSSGMGKSRLADELGKICPMVNYIIRHPSHSSGFPDADKEIVDLLLEHPTSDDQAIFKRSPSAKLLVKDGYWQTRLLAAWNHGTVLGLLQASFEYMTEWLDSESPNLHRLEHVASSRHTDMAPLPGTGSRSPKRAKFCERVCSRAREIRRELIDSESWRRAFNNDEFASAIRQQLANPLFAATDTFHNVAKDLCMKLQNFRRQNENDPMLVFVLDEPSSLLKSFKGLYATFNRVISLLKDLPIWFLYLSTESRIERIFPPETGQSRPTETFVTAPSPRLGEEDGSSLARPTPFLAFPLDVRAHMLMLDKDKRRVELSKPFVTFDQADNLVLYGRPIWTVYKDQPQQLLSLAQKNLLGSGDSYDPTNEDHVFAILSFRVLLDICLENPMAASLAKRAVDGSMQVVTSMHPVTGAVRTVTPSEPILAVTSIQLLCDGPSNTNWSVSTRTLCQKLLQGALVEKGLKGELYARWVLTLARDASCPPLKDSASLPPLNFTVELFLTALYGLSHLDLYKIDRKILEAKMNFTHFVAAGENLSPGVMGNLTHELLQRCAAMQLAFHQPTYDLYLPYYFGAENEQFDPEKAGGILVQVKNKETGTNPKKILKEEFFPVDGPIPSKSAGERNRKRDGPYFIFQDSKQSLLLLIMDLGVSVHGSTSRVQVSRTNKDDLPVVWAIHSRGHDAQTFRCLTQMNCEPVCEQFFLDTTPRTNHDICAMRNDRFAKLRRAYRYPQLPTPDDSKSKKQARSASAEEDDNKQGAKRRKVVGSPSGH